MADWGVIAQRAAELHLNACLTAFYASEEELTDQHGDDPVAAVESPASAPFDGCDTCQIREVLHAAWPVIAVAAIDEFVEEVDDAAEIHVLDMRVIRRLADTLKKELMSRAPEATKAAQATATAEAAATTTSTEDAEGLSHGQ